MNSNSITGTAGDTEANKGWVIVLLPWDIPASWQKLTNRMCEGEPYTRDQCNLNLCNGWNGLTEEQCKQKCIDNDFPGGCSYMDGTRNCVAAFYENGWCQLYNVCPSHVSNSGAVMFRKGPSYLQIDQVEPEAVSAEESGLALALWLALRNLTKFQTELHPNRSSLMLDEHLATLSDLVTGLYGEMHKEMGSDGPVYCPYDEYEKIPMCITIATCLIEAKVFEAQPFFPCFPLFSFFSSLSCPGNTQAPISRLTHVSHVFLQYFSHCLSRVFFRDERVYIRVDLEEAGVAILLGGVRRRRHHNFLELA